MIELIWNSLISAEYLKENGAAFFFVCVLTAVVIISFTLFYYSFRRDN